MEISENEPGYSNLSGKKLFYGHIRLPVVRLMRVMDDESNDGSSYDSEMNRNILTIKQFC